MDSSAYPNFPVPGGIPQPNDPTQPPVVILPDGYPSRPVGQRIYITTQGDWWDMIALRVYGRQRGNEHLMYRLLEANYEIMEFVNFPAGVPVIIPDVGVSTDIPLVPWKKAMQLPAT